MRRQTILFLAANPNGTDQLALDQEARAIQIELRGSGYREHFEFKTRWAAEPLDLLRALREIEPTVVHFSGHGGPDGLFFHAKDGGAKLVSTDAVAEAFGAAGSSVKLVVLSTCYSETQAAALLAHVECVVGFGASAHADMAGIFAIGFYGGLGQRASVAAAFKHGVAAIKLEGLPNSTRPQLRVHPDMDADRLIPAALAQTDPGVCPYPGMQPYSADTAQYFYGRNAEVGKLLGRLHGGEREIYVIGPSGCGKSSLVAAGVLPRLIRVGSGLAPFVVRWMRPGDHPIARLSEALGASEGEVVTGPANAIVALLRHRALSTSVLIVIDQLEELFTLPSAEERATFLCALQALKTESRCVVVGTLRADFFGDFMESPLWTDRISISHIEVGPLRGKALREAIRCPAQKVGVVVEPGLIERLFSEAAGEPGILPLLQDILVQLWERRRDRLLTPADNHGADHDDRLDLTLADYEALSEGDRSGIAVALSSRADATLLALTPGQQVIVRRILLRLISFGEGRSDTRRQQPLSKLRAAGDDDVDFDVVLRRLVANRLLTTDNSADPNDARVDLAHEVMTTAWPTLSSWVKTHRADEQPGGLLDRFELAEFEAWRRTEPARELGESASVADLVTASRAARRRWRRGIVGGIAFALTVIAGGVILVVLAGQRANEADSERKRWKASQQESEHRLALYFQETGRQLLLDGHPLRALPLLVEARKKGEEGVMLRMLYWTATRYFLLSPPLAHDGSVASATFSPDGKRVITASDNAAYIWDVSTGKQLATLVHPRDVRSAAFSADGNRIVTASADNTARIWDAATHEQLAILEHQTSVQKKLQSGGGQTTRREEVRSAVFSPDGGYVVTAGDDRTARIWDAATGKRPPRLLKHQASVQSAVFNLDGTRIVTASADNTARIWDTATGNPLSPSLKHHAVVRGAAFSPDSTRLVTASDDKTACLWDAMTGKHLATLEHQGIVLSAAFSPDGARIVTASDDKTARLWDAMTGKHLATLEHQGEVRCAVFSLDGTRIVTASGDGTARVWDARMGQPLPHKGAVRSAAFSPDGTRVVTASSDKTARVWEVATGKLLTTLEGHEGAVNSAAFSPDGARIVTASDDDERSADIRTARIWDAVTGKPLTRPLEHRGVVWSAVFSPDGTRVVTASADMTARIWDAVTGKPVSRPLEHRGVVWSAVFSPDGTRVVTASADNTARIWGVKHGVQSALPLEHRGEVRSATFSPDGTRVVTASWDNTARVWDAATGNALSPPLPHQGIVRSAAFSPDNTRVVTASDDTTARVWDAITGKSLAIFPEHRGTVWSAVFNHDGTRVVTASDDGTARVWDVATGKTLATLEHHGRLRSATFSADGNHVVTASHSNTAHVWEVQLDQTLEEWSAVATRASGTGDHRRGSSVDPLYPSFGR
ncbi:MAG: hypothetical protein E6J90_18860 [Deltaproteobacteria bacterium]|nr:MAG: hypothetical protein E6J90_18860 [Deltaproteobacteria bacterium]